MHASLPDGEVICSLTAVTRFAGSRTARYSSCLSVMPSPVSVYVLPYTETTYAGYYVAISTPQGSERQI